MQLGAFLPHWARGDPADRARLIARYSARAEEVGVGPLWAGGDHILTPPNPLYENLSFLDPFTLVPYAAASTTAEVGFVYAGWRRHPILAAKALATLLFICGGRDVHLAPVVGWFKREHDVLGLDHSQRGRSTDEWLDAVELLLTEEHVSFDGDFWQFEDVTIEPVARRTPVFWIAGGGGHLDVPPEESRMHPNVAARIARFGRWLIGGTASLQQVDRDLEVLAEAVAHRGTTLDEIEIAQSTFVHVVETSDRRDALARQAVLYGASGRDDPGFRDAVGDVYLAGTVDDILGQIQARADRGITRMFLVPFPEHEQAQLELWSKHLLPAMGDLPGAT